jgi:hypothetical protein
MIILFSQSCTMFKKDETLLSSHQKSNGEKIGVYYVGLGATSNDVIQVKKLKEDRLLWVSEKYNFLTSSVLLGDTLLRLVLTDTGYHNHSNKFDTIFVNVK